MPVTGLKVLVAANFECRKSFPTFSYIKAYKMCIIVPKLVCTSFYKLEEGEIKHQIAQKKFQAPGETQTHARNLIIITPAIEDSTGDLVETSRPPAVQVLFHT